MEGIMDIYKYIAMSILIKKREKYAHWRQLQRLLISYITSKGISIFKNRIFYVFGNKSIIKFIDFGKKN